MLAKISMELCKKVSQEHQLRGTKSSSPRTENALLKAARESTAPESHLTLILELSILVSKQKRHNTCLDYISHRYSKQNTAKTSREIFLVFTFSKDRNEEDLQGHSFEFFCLFVKLIRKRGYGENSIEKKKGQKGFCLKTSRRRSDFAFVFSLSSSSNASMIKKESAKEGDINSKEGNRTSDNFTLNNTRFITSFHELHNQEESSTIFLVNCVISTQQKDRQQQLISYYGQLVFLFFISFKSKKAYQQISSVLVAKTWNNKQQCVIESYLPSCNNDPLILISQYYIILINLFYQFFIDPCSYPRKLLYLLYFTTSFFRFPFIYPKKREISYFIPKKPVIFYHNFHLYSLSTHYLGLKNHHFTFFSFISRNFDTISQYFWAFLSFYSRILYIQQMHSSKKSTLALEQLHPQGLLSVKSMTNIQCTSKINQVSTPRVRAFEKYEVIIQSQKIQTQLKLIEWRSKTEFPIVKVLFYKILHKKMLNQCPVVQIAIEHFNTSLFSLPKMPLFQIFYLLKESIIGFERLYDRFGGFQINNKMVLINKNLKCRVWINQNITLNFPSKKMRVTQTQFKNQIIKIYEEKCIKSTLSCQFFRSALNIKNMVEVIHFVEAFAKSNRIILASKFNNIYASLGSMADKNVQNRFETTSMKKIPKFIQELREMRRVDKNTDSKSFYSPAIKKEGLLDRKLSHHRLKKKQSDKSDIDSTSKSFLTPKSLASNEIKQQHRSNNEQAADTPKKITKKQSHQNFYNTSLLSNFEPIEPLKTEKVMTKLESNAQVKKTNEKHQFRLNKIHKFRKLSNGDDLHHKREDKQKLLFQPKEPIDQDSKFRISLLSPVGRRKGEVSLKSILQNSSKIGQTHQQKQDVFSKNGWLKRFNSLTVDQFRDTIHSHFDGSDILSDQLRLCNLDLGLLGQMGKQLRGSIFLQKQR